LDANLLLRAETRRSITFPNLAMVSSIAGSTSSPSSSDDIEIP
jgi:hypothetical protein